MSRPQSLLPLDCPLKHLFSNPDHLCSQDDCAWWVKNWQRCAIHVLALSVTDAAGAYLFRKGG